MNLDALNRALSPIWDAIRSTAARAVVRNSDSSKGTQTLQIDLGHGDLRDGVENYEQLGVTARPLDGAETFPIFPGGRSQPPVVLVVADRRYRVQGLAKGELAIYTDEGIAIKIGRGQVVEITGASVLVSAESVEIQATDTVEVTAGTSITLTAPQINLNS